MKFFVIVVQCVLFAVVSEGERQLTALYYQQYPLMTWNDANEQCRELGMELVTMDTEDVRFAMQKFVKDNGPWHEKLKDFWIGLHNVGYTSSTKEFIWSSSCKALDETKTFWSNSNSWDKYCVLVDKSLDLKSWTTTSCNRKIGSVMCEKYEGKCSFKKREDKKPNVTPERVVELSDVDTRTKCHENCLSYVGTSECWGIVYKKSYKICRIFLATSHSELSSDLKETNGGRTDLKFCFSGDTFKGLHFAKYTSSYPDNFPHTGCSNKSVQSTAASLLATLFPKSVTTKRKVSGFLATHLTHKTTRSTSFTSKTTEETNTALAVSNEPYSTSLIGAPRHTTPVVPLHDLRRKASTTLSFLVWKVKQSTSLNVPTNAEATSILSDLPPREATTSTELGLLHTSPNVLILYNASSTKASKSITQPFIQTRQNTHATSLYRSSSNAFTYPPMGRTNGNAYTTTSIHDSSTAKRVNLTTENETTTPIHIVENNTQGVTNLRSTSKNDIKFTSALIESTKSENTSFVVQTTDHKGLMITVDVNLPTSNSTTSPFNKTVNTNVTQWAIRNQAATAVNPSQPDVLTTTHYKDTSGRISPSKCRCRCPIRVISTKEAEVEHIDTVLNSLTLDARKFSATRRKLTSADDPRPSAKSVGSVGIIILAFVIFGIFILDVGTFSRNSYSSAL